MICLFDCNGPWEIWKHGNFLYATSDKTHAMEMYETGYVVVLQGRKL